MLRVSGFVAALAFGAFASTTAVADATPGFISAIMPMPNGAVLFDHSGERSGAPACQHTGLPRRWAFSTAGNEGQARLAVLLSAYAMKKQIRIIGQAACPNWADTESLLYFVVED